MARILSLILLLAFASPASAAGPIDELIISTGRDGGSYFYIAERLKTALLVTTPQPPRVLVVTSAGSTANLSRLDDPASGVNIALAQQDALDAYLALHPQFADEFLVLGQVGLECALLIAAKEGALASASDLKKARDLTLSVGDVDSGAALTYAKMVEIDAAFANTTPVPVDTMEALLQLKVGKQYSKLAGALLVQRPRRASAPVKLLLENPDLYRLIPITRSDLASADASAYSFQEVTVGGAHSGSKAKVETVCTEGLLLASKGKLSKEMRGQISAIMLSQSEQIIGPAE